MAFRPVDISKIQLDNAPNYADPSVRNAAMVDLYGEGQPQQSMQPQAGMKGFKPVDIKQIKLDNAPSPTMDVAKTIGSNIAKGGVDALMTLPNLLNQAAAGPQYLYEGLVGEDRPDFKPWQPFLSSEDVVSGSAIDYKPQTDAGKVAEFPTRLLTNLVAPTAINKAGNAALSVGKDFVAKPTTQNLISSEASGVVKTPKAPLKTSADLDEMAGLAFKQADELGGMYRPQDVSIPFSKTIAEVKPRPIAGKTLTSEEQKLVQHLSEYEGLKGAQLSFDDVRRIDSGLTQKINANFIDARTGQPDANGRKLMILQTKLREALDNVPENAANDALRNANRLWKARIILDELDTLAERASMTQNPAQALRTGYKNLYFDKDRIRGWPKEAVELLKQAATPGIKDELLIPIGSRMMAIIAGGTGDIGGAATAQIVGMGARGMRAAAAAKQGAKVQQSVVDDTLANLREVKVPEKSNIPLMLTTSDKMSRLPMSDKEVNIARKLMEGTPPTGVDASGGSIKPPVYYHGGNELSSSGKGVTFFTQNKSMAETYADMSKDRFGMGRVQQASLNLKNTAPESVVLREAKNIGIPKDELEMYTPASLFDEAVVNKSLVSKLIKRLKELGYDSAEATDIAYGGNTTDKATVVFDRTKINPIKE